MGHHEADTPIVLPVGDEVDGYCDLRKRCSSLKALKGPNKGRVVAKPANVVLRDVEFRVNQGGLQRARTERVRNVHAFARGTVSMDTTEQIKHDPNAVRIDYNPFKEGRFVRHGDRTAISRATALAIEGKTAWALSPT